MCVCVCVQMKVGNSLIFTLQVWLQDYASIRRELKEDKRLSEAWGAADEESSSSSDDEGGGQQAVGMEEEEEVDSEHEHGGLKKYVEARNAAEAVTEKAVDHPPGGGRAAPGLKLLAAALALPCMGTNMAGLPTGFAGLLATWPEARRRSPPTGRPGRLLSRPRRQAALRRKAAPPAHPPTPDAPQTPCPTPRPSTTPPRLRKPTPPRPS